MDLAWPVSDATEASDWTSGSSWVCPLTTTRRGLDLHVEVEATADTGLDDTSYVHWSFERCSTTDSHSR
jgi:mRNA-degrading endonuclease toxin of MazEF toxin-antitoxin module